MSDAGRSAQYGFEFQKLVFLCECCNLTSVSESISYEHIDDIDIENNDTDQNDPLTIVATVKHLIQCKSGIISESIFKRVLENWLISMTDDVCDFTLFSENPISYNPLNYASEIKEQIINSSKEKNRKGSIKYYLVKKFINDETFDDNLFNECFQKIFKNYHFMSMNVEGLLSDASALFFRHFTNAHSDLESIAKERFCEIKSIIFDDISNSIFSKQQYTLTFCEFSAKIAKVVSSIDENVYHVSYDIFKKNKTKAVARMFESKKREVNFLKQIFTSEENIKNLLTNELFYEHYRNFYYEIGNSKRISEIENLAHDQYVYEADGSDVNRQLFDRVILFDATSSFDDFVKPLPTGCIVFLSGDSAPDEYFIDWNGLNGR